MQKALCQELFLMRLKFCDIELRDEKKAALSSASKNEFLLPPFRFATLRTGRMLPNALTPRYHTGTWVSISTNRLGTRLLY